MRGRPPAADGRTLLSDAAGGVVYFTPSCSAAEKPAVTGCVINPLRVAASQQTGSNLVWNHCSSANL